MPEPRIFPPLRYTDDINIDTKERSVIALAAVVIFARYWSEPNNMYKVELISFGITSTHRIEGEESARAFIQEMYENFQNLITVTPEEWADGLCREEEE